jgi:hypothetical protein
LEISLSSFLSYEDMTLYLKESEKKYPDRVQLTSLATSPEGRNIWCIKLGKHSGALTKKPGFLLQGNMHADELAGSVMCLFAMEQLLQSYERDQQIQNLLDEQMIYIIPRIAVDGAEFVLSTGCKVRSKMIYTKENNVPFPEDLNQDGKILMMRWKDDNGRYITCKEDSRLMLPVLESERNCISYSMCIEGLIHQWDGGQIESSRLYCDFNRDFPAGWKFRPEWTGMGRYPLSQIETKAVADFIIKHPNIYGALDFHTGNPAIFYPSSMTPGNDKSILDHNLIHRLGKMGERLTGFPLLSGYSEVIGGYPDKLQGSFNDWAYEHNGIISYVVELGLIYNSIGLYPYTTPTKKLKQSYSSHREREEKVGLALFQWHDENLDAELFYDWKPYKHPQLGEVEIGGWNMSVYSNPELDDLTNICERCYRFFLDITDHIPKIEIKNTEVKNIASGIQKISFELVNTGDIPTYITEQGKKVHPHDRLTVVIDIDGAKFIIGKKSQDIDHIQPNGGRKGMEWLIAMQKGNEIKVTVSSNRYTIIEAIINCV